MARQSKSARAAANQQAGGGSLRTEKRAAPTHECIEEKRREGEAPTEKKKCKKSS